MKVFETLLIVAAMGATAPASAAVYKCVGQDGKTTWSDKPCTIYRPGPAQAATDTQAEASAAQEAPPPAGEAEAATPAGPSQEELEQLQFEQKEALEAEFARRVERKAGVLWLAGALMLVGWVMHIVAAARQDRIAWAICLFLFSPFSNLPFTALHWQKAKVGFFVYLAGGALMAGTIVSLYPGLVPT